MKFSGEILNLSAIKNKVASKGNSTDFYPSKSLYGCWGVLLIMFKMLLVL